MALGLASTVLIFPQTLNHLVLNGFVLGGLGPIQGLLKMQDDVLKTDPDSHAAWGGLAKKAYALRKGFMAATTQLSASSRMLHLEVSRGRISAGQLQLLIAKSRDLGTRAFGLASFVVMVEERHQGIKRYEDNPLPHHTKKVKEEATQAFEAEKSSGHSLKDLLPELGASTAELRQAAQAALGGASAWLGQINNTRWKKTPADAPTLEDRDALRERLIAVLAEYRKSKHFSLLERYRGKFDANGNLIPAPEHEISSSVYGLFRCFILTSSLIAFCQSLIEFLEFVRVIEVANPQNKLQFPGKFVQTVVENATDSTTGVTGYDDTVNDPLADDDSDDDRAAQLAKDDQKSESSADLKKRKYGEYKYPECTMPFADHLQLATPMRVTPPTTSRSLAASCLVS